MEIVNINIINDEKTIIILIIPKYLFYNSLHVLSCSRLKSRKKIFLCILSNNIN